RITVKDPDPRRVGRRFSNAIMELALAGYAGFHTTTPPTAESSYGVYWPALVPGGGVDHVVVLHRGSRRGNAPPPARPTPGAPRAGPPPAARLPPAQAPAAPLPAAQAPAAQVPAAQVPAGGPTRRVPLGRVCAARSGDKGGNANVGVWTPDAAAFGWLRDYLT